MERWKERITKKGKKEEKKIGVRVGVGVGWKGCGVEVKQWKEV